MYGKNKNNTGIVFNIALNYGGREELLNVTYKIAEDVKMASYNLKRLQKRYRKIFVYSRSARSRFAYKNKW